MADTVYECMFIFNANAYARNPGGASAGIEEIVKSVGGEVLASRLFDERKLAYPINGHRKGVYWLTYAKMESTSIPKFNRACQLTDIILRHLVVKIDPRLVDTMVAVAQGKQTETPEAAETETAPEEDKATESDSEKSDAAEATVES